MTTTKRISDATLVRKANMINDLNAEIADINRRVANLKDQIEGELARRGTDVIEHGSVRVTRVQAKRSEYDYEGLCADLSPKQRKLIQKTVFDRAGLASAVQSGVITPQEVAPHYSEHLNKPYVVITSISPS